jgi:hypothetical protein
MPMTKSSRVNQRNREIVMTEIHRSLLPGSQRIRGRPTLLAAADPSARARPGRILTLMA